ncbi:hypothetical protein PV327_008658 [Microctonus hyperodae]|uniref:Peptidase M13 C-terminal domain-containing protein n=1 Tax=Microctonus hyperodae TaxID=165561 RepID=A0AA39KHN0_MICHY|nr:hypothetical protein PV327_008658 [Microctonus hyperodae]
MGNGQNSNFLSCQNWSKKHENEQSLPDLPFTSQQIFWISAATVWCVKYQPMFLENLIESDPHCPGEFRVLGSLSNMPPFAKDFNCPFGSNMNPKDKCEFL